MTTDTLEGLGLDLVTAKNIRQWLDGFYDEKTKDEVREFLKKKPTEIADAFYTNLSFGTAGLRGIMGVGCNRMNDYTVRAATQGLANYLNMQPAPAGRHSAFIGFDSRHHSRTFAEETARVFAANGIKVYLCKDLRPTPLVSFGCRYKHCSTAVMITASHNPAIYNGYKVYWNDGGQILPPHDKAIINEVKKITDPRLVQCSESLQHPLIEIVDKEIDNAYLSAAKKLQLLPEEAQHHGKDLKIVYTSLHGTGITLEPDMLKDWGFSNVTYVDQQIIPDPDFPTTKYPNPEEKAAMMLGLKKLKEIQGDVLIATDPDADRVAAGVHQNGEEVLITGNQMACICLEFICKTLSEQGKMPANAAFIKSLVTTELFQAICDSYQKPCLNVLTGFKYIAEKIRQWESEPHGYQYIFGGEESYGYLFGTNTRDKDGILVSALISEIALHAKRRGQTLVDFLHEIYHKYGVYYDNVLSIKFPETKAGKDQIAAGMEKLRLKTPQEIDGVDVLAIEDYQTSVKRTFKASVTETLQFPQTDMLLFWLTDGSKVVIRPSGTEPKIKIYCEVTKKKPSPIQATIQSLQSKAQRIIDEIETLLTSV
jgi:phosphoglucomutase/phosphomannomutase